MKFDVDEFSKNLKFQVKQADPKDRLTVIQDALKALPDPPRTTVEHFIAATLIYSEGEISKVDTESQRIRAIQNIATMAFIFGIASIVAGVLVGYYSTEQSQNSFTVLGADFRTTNTSVAFISVGALLVLFTFKPALKNLSKSDRG